MHAHNATVRAYQISLPEPFLKLKNYRNRFNIIEILALESHLKINCAENE